MNIVRIGSIVYTKKGKIDCIFTIVSENPDPLSGKITNTSPIGSMLLGKKENDRITINTESGIIEYIIYKIK
jgi:transcription elongation factor GreA